MGAIVDEDAHQPCARLHRPRPAARVGSLPAAAAKPWMAVDVSSRRRSSRISQPTAELVTEEVFGPVLAVQTFDDEAEAIAMANNTVYGLAASVWTQRSVAGAPRRRRSAGRHRIGQHRRRD